MSAVVPSPMNSSAGHGRPMKALKVYDRSCPCSHRERKLLKVINLMYLKVQGFRC